MKTKSYKDLIVWQKSIELVKQIYLLTALLPKEEIFALSSQMRRASISIPSNIAEGYMRKHQKEYLQFLSIALGSAAELETQLILVQTLYPKILTSPTESILVEVSKMLYTLIKNMEGKSIR